MEIVLLDLEATCWENKSIGLDQEIIELAAIKYDEYGEELERFQSLVRPVMHPNLSRYCENLTGLSTEDLAGKPDFSLVGQKFEEWFYASDSILVSWGKKDKEILQEEARFHQLDPSVYDDMIDLKAEYRELKRNHALIGLHKAMKYEGIEWEGAQHRAMPDTENMAMLFLKYLDEWPFINWS